MNATRWHKRRSEVFPVEVHVNLYPAAQRLKLTLATTGVDSPDWLELEMSKPEADELVRRISEVLK